MTREEMFELTYPYLLLLFPLPFLLRYLLPKYKEQSPAVRTPFFSDFSQILEDSAVTGDGAVRHPLMHWLIFLACWPLLLLALTRPQWIEEPMVKNIPTRDLLLAVDLSGSMETEDFTSSGGQMINRLEAVKEVLDEFLEKREGDRVGLIFFGTAPFVQVPFTEDLDVCRTLLNEAQVRMAGPQTMIGDTIGLAITVFDKSDVKDRVLILLTDGNDTGSAIPPEEAAMIAREKGVVIHTVAVGDPAAAGESEMDEASLRKIAESSQGSYFHANDKTELQHIYATLDQLETKEIETVSYHPKRDLFHWPLILLLLITFVFQLSQAVRFSLSQTRRDNG